MTHEISWFKSSFLTHRLKTPIPLTIRRDEDDDVFAENAEFDVIGYGRTVDQAVEDARHSVSRQYEWKFETELPVPLEMIEWFKKVDALMV